MIIITNPHDKFFKEIFGNKENVIDFINGIFPKEITKNLDMETLALDKNSYIDEHLQEYFSDVVYNCIYKGKIPIKITILFEHKSYYVQYPGIQLLKYMVQTWDHQMDQEGEDITPVIPIVVYHGKKKWNSKPIWKYFKGIDENLKRFMPDFEYILTDLSKYSDHEIVDVLFKNALVKSAILVMKNIFDRDKLKKHTKDYFEIAESYFGEEKGLKFIDSLLRYLLYGGGLHPTDVAEEVKKISHRGGKAVMTAAEKLVEELKLEGIKKERAKGIAEYQELLIKFLTTKFGKALTQKDKKFIIKTKDHDKLKAALESILAATEKNEVLDKLK
ncbi:MAG: Rpn family recombination-promoting nuclease/putative transposase [bacterium]|nr:Rpn family recombination-promoting nuclease/putative transposase [bacterium]